MRSHMGLPIKLMIRHFGETVSYKKRIKTDLGDGEAEYSYETQEPVRGQFLRITPFDEMIDKWGKRIEADMIGSFLPDVDIEEYGLLYIRDGWYEITTKLPHATSGITDYIEVLLRRRMT